jgi:hypothetical protein
MYIRASRRESGIHGTLFAFTDNHIPLILSLFSRADAGDTTQGVPGGSVRRFRVDVPERRRRGRRAVYVVFEGLAPGVYNTW